MPLPEIPSLDRRFDAWRSMPIHVHVVAVGLLAVAIALIYRGDVFFDGTLIDELAYLKGARRIAAGQSPFGGGSTGYLYPAAFAILCAELAERLGEIGMLRVLRTVNILGLATSLWLATAWLRCGLAARLGVAVVIAAASPIVRDGMSFGNLSFAVSGLVLAAFALSSHPLLSGALFGLSAGVKPIAPAFVASLLLGERAPTRRPILAASLAAAITLTLYFAFPYAVELLAMTREAPLARTVSPHRFARLLELGVHPLAISALLLALGIGLARRYSPLGDTGALAVATATAIAATPIVWSHTLLLTFPLQAAALHQAVLQRSSKNGSRNLVGVALAVLAIQLSRGAGSIDDQPVPAQLLAVALPALAPAVLAAYVVTRARRTTHPGPNGGHSADDDHPDDPAGGAVGKTL